MQKDKKIIATPASLCHLWQSRRTFRGFGSLLFYCHMLMVFSALTRIQLAEMPEYTLLVSAGKLLVPTLFTLTTISLFIPSLFWAGLALGLVHIPFAAVFIVSGPAPALPWMLGLLSLLGIIIISFRIKIAS